MESPTGRGDGCTPLSTEEVTGFGGLVKRTIPLADLVKHFSRRTYNPLATLTAGAIPGPWPARMPEATSRRK